MTTRKPKRTLQMVNDNGTIIIGWIIKCIDLYFEYIALHTKLDVNSDRTQFPYFFNQNKRQKWTFGNV